jgi:hypothetical protein
MLASLEPPILSNSSNPHFTRHLRLAPFEKIQSCVNSYNYLVVDHRIKVTADIYGHLAPGGNRDAVDRLDDDIFLRT